MRSSRVAVKLESRRTEAREAREVTGLSGLRRSYVADMIAGLEG
jgi:hypothetical protein